MTKVSYLETECQQICGQITILEYRVIILIGSVADQNEFVMWNSKGFDWSIRWKQ